MKKIYTFGCFLSGAALIFTLSLVFQQNRFAGSQIPDRSSAETGYQTVYQSNASSMLETDKDKGKDKGSDKGKTGPDRSPNKDKRKGCGSDGI